MRSGPAPAFPKKQGSSIGERERAGLAPVTRLRLKKNAVLGLILRWLGGFAGQVNRQRLGDCAGDRSAPTGNRVFLAALSFVASAVMQVTGSRGIAKVGRGSYELAPVSRSIPSPRLQKEQ